jgi:hypothetical protein
MPSLTLLALAALPGLTPPGSPAVLPALTQPGSPADLRRLAPAQVEVYRAVKPSAAEVRWRQVPWLLDLATALAQAKAEKRPLVVWTADDEPLERC